MRDLGGGGGLKTDLSEESDWLLAHSVRIPDVGLDDLGEGFLHSLQSVNTTHRNEYVQTKRAFVHFNDMSSWFQRFKPTAY